MHKIIDYKSTKRDSFLVNPFRFLYENQSIKSKVVLFSKSAFKRVFLMVWVKKAGYRPNIGKFLIVSTWERNLLGNGCWVPGFGSWGHLKVRAKG